MRAMRFHMHLLPTYFPDRDPPFDVFYRQILDQIELAEELGWECFWFTEHHFQVYGGPVPNPAVMMSAAAARTSKIHLGSAISALPLHHPIQTAEDYAMVDVMSGGRLEFGIGLGNTPGDARIYGVPWDERRARYEEAAEIIVKAWRNERFSHHGKFWQFEDVALYPRPMQTPCPRIWAASTSPEGAAWAGRHGFDLMTVSHPRPPEHVRPGVQAWKKALLEAGKNPRDHHCKLHVRVWVDENGERARQTAESAITRYEEISAKALERPAPGPHDWAGMLSTGRNCYGTPDQVIRHIKAAQENFDFDIFSTSFNFGGLAHEDVKRSMRLFAREVMPAFR
jgi:alkanesulfonate monooxygenase SsuD/methylene tetrahydromethanopterin reductase-like flavin-dependent oxidoreductase (luciferase family)